MISSWNMHCISLASIRSLTLSATTAGVDVLGMIIEGGKQEKKACVYEKVFACPVLANLFVCFFAYNLRPLRQSCLLLLPFIVDQMNSDMLYIIGDLLDSQSFIYLSIYSFLFYLQDTREKNCS